MGNKMIFFYILQRKSSLFDSRVLFNRLRGDRGGSLGGVVLLNVGRRCRHRSPRFARCHAQADNHANQHQKSANKLSHLSSRIWLVIL